jgi:hypothetical protein
MFTQIVSKKYLRTLVVLHAVLALGQLLFLAIALIGKNGHSVEQSQVDTNRMLLLMALLMVAGSIAGGIYMHKRKVLEIRMNNNLRQKLDEYTISLIIRFALMEVASIFCTVGYLLSSHYLFVFFTLVVLVFFVVVRPTKGNVLRDLDLIV